MILVAGATGNVGGAVAEALCGMGKPVRALVRATSDAARVARLEEAGAEIARGELRDQESLARACAGVETVVSGATAIASLGTDPIDAVDRDGQVALVNEARDAGAGHFVYVSFSGNITGDDPLTQAKRAVEEHLRTSGLAYTILRPSFFMEAWLGPPLGWDLTSGTVRVLGTGEQRVSWISAQDVVAAILACVDNPDAHGETIELGGPQALSPLEVVRLAESLSGRSVAVEHVPAEALAEQLHEAGGTDAAVFPSLMMAQTRGDELAPAPEWLRPQVTVEDYLRGAAT